MSTTQKQSKLYSFYMTVAAAAAFAILFYLFIVCYIGTYRLISDIGNIRVLFLNPLIVLTVAMVAALAGGIFIVRSGKAMNLLTKLDEEKKYDRVMRILKFAVFAECILFSVGTFGMDQRVDQFSIQQAAYGFSWGYDRTLTPPGYLGIYPNNLGMTLYIYCLSFLTGHYNNAVIMLINSVMVPFIYSDLAEIGGKFGLSRKSKVAVMIAGLCFLPLQAKTMVIYGDVPGLFLAIKALKRATEITQRKSRLKDVLVVVFCSAFAYVFKNNYIIFAMAVMIFLAAEFIKQRRFRELYVPLAVLIVPVLLNKGICLTAGVAFRTQISSGANKLSWIAMGMQEESGIYSGYNAITYAESGFDAAAQGEVAKNDIINRLKEFAGDPNSFLGFYVRKIMVQWSDPTHCGFEFISRNAYLNEQPSQLVWLLANPGFIRVAASFLKLFQLLIFLGGAVFTADVLTKKKGTPALLLITTFIGGYLFHIIWEAAPTYTMSYMVVLIPVGVSGLIKLIKKLSVVKLKELSKVKVQASASGVTIFVVGAFMFLLAAAGVGTVRTILVEGRDEYKTYMNEDVFDAREPIAEGVYMLRSAAGNPESEGIKVELVRYAGQYRMRVVDIDAEDDVFLTEADGKITVDWFSYGTSQTFVILRNGNGTYSICHGMTSGLCKDEGIAVKNFMDYTYLFGTDEYEEYIEEHPEMTWELLPA